MKDVIYFDNSASSWPKPDVVFSAIEEFNRCIGANPGRSGHRLSVDAARVLFNAREALAELFGVDESFRIIFSRNATAALNLAIFGLLRPGDHTITSSMEHNSIMRPLRAMEKRGVDLTVVPCSSKGELDPRDIVKSIRSDTKAIYITHASNVTGTIMPIAEIGSIAREHEVIFCVDAAQSAGALPINIQEMNIDLLAFTGHKSLFGPQGTGGLYIGPGLEKQIDPIEMGGTGSRSEFEDQPDFLPDKYESGTPNAFGIAGLGAGVRFVHTAGIENIRAKEIQLTSNLLSGLMAMDNVHVHGCLEPDRQLPIVSFTMDGLSPSEIALALDEKYDIMSRPGLHCAPSAHRTIGTFSEGTLRLSIGFFNTLEQVQKAVESVASLASL